MTIEAAVGTAAGTSSATAQGTIRPQGTVSPTRAAFVQEEFRSVVWQSTPIKDAYGKVARDTKDQPIQTFFDNMEDCYAIAQERGRIIGSHARRFRVVVDSIITEADLGFATTLPGARLIDTELVADMDVAIAALESVDFNSEQTVLQVWGRMGDEPSSDHRIRSSVGTAMGSSSGMSVGSGGAPSAGSSAGSSAADAPSAAIVGAAGSASGSASAAASAFVEGLLLLSGDMQSGTDHLLLSGDMQSGTDREMIGD